MNTPLSARKHTPPSRWDMHATDTTTAQHAPRINAVEYMARTRGKGHGATVIKKDASNPIAPMQNDQRPTETTCCPARHLLPTTAAVLDRIPYDPRCGFFRSHSITFSPVVTEMRCLMRSLINLSCPSVCSM